MNLRHDLLDTLTSLGVVFASELQPTTKMTVYEVETYDKEHGRYSRHWTLPNPEFETDCEYITGDDLQTRIYRNRKIGSLYAINYINKYKFMLIEAENQETQI